MLYKFKWGPYVDSSGDTYSDLSGWIKQDNPVMQPATGRGVCHDCLEHGSRDTGSPETAVIEELIAFGRMAYIRWEVGTEEKYWSDYQVLSRELRAVWDFVEQDPSYQFTFPEKAPEVRASKDYSRVLETFNRAAANLSDPDEVEEYPDLLPKWESFKQIAPYYLMKGFRSAMQQWRGTYVWEEVWQMLKRAVDRLPKGYMQEGDELHIRIIRAKGEVTLFLKTWEDTTPKEIDFWRFVV